MSRTEQIDLSKLQIHREQPSQQGAPNRSGLRVVLYIGGATVLALVAVFFFRNIGPDEAVEVGTVALVSPADAISLLTASGYVVAQRKAAIASKATGRIVSLSYHEGDNVMKGEVIARIESADVEAALAQAKADLEQAK